MDDIDEKDVKKDVKKCYKENKLYNRLTWTTAFCYYPITRF